MALFLPAIYLVQVSKQAYYTTTSNGLCFQDNLGKPAPESKANHSGF